MFFFTVIFYAIRATTVVVAPSAQNRKVPVVSPVPLPVQILTPSLPGRTHSQGAAHD